MGRVGLLSPRLGTRVAPRAAGCSQGSLSMVYSIYNFISWRVQQCPRSCNRVAHELAILGSICEPDAEAVVAPIPDFIACFIAKDSAPSD